MENHKHASFRLVNKKHIGIPGSNDINNFRSKSLSRDTKQKTLTKITRDDCFIGDKNQYSDYNKQLDNLVQVLWDYYSQQRNTKIQEVHSGCDDVFGMCIIICVSMHIFINHYIYVKISTENNSSSYFTLT